MKRIIPVLAIAVMMFSGCACSRNTANEPITDNMNDNTVNENNTNVKDEAIVDNATDNNVNHMDETGVGTQSSNVMRGMTNSVGNAIDDMGNAVEDVGRGANNVMHDVGNAIR